MPTESLHSAREAAQRLGVPAQAKTFTRRAREAREAGDERVQYVGQRWLAPMSFWREVQLRQAGRPRGSRNRHPYGFLARWADLADAYDEGAS